MCMHINTSKKIYYKELAHTIMEAGKSQCLQQASWRPKRANGAVLAWMPTGLRRRKSPCFSSTMKAEKNWCPRSKEVSQASGAPSYSSCFSQVFKWLNENHSHQGRQSALPSLPNQMLISSINTLHRHIQNNVWPSTWAPCSLVKMIHKMNHHKYPHNLYLDLTIVNIFPYLLT